MKIVNREEFLEIEKPVIYSEVLQSGEAIYLSGLYCKTSGTLFQNDWIEQYLLKEVKREESDVGTVHPTSFELDLDITYRNGLYDPHVKMAMYDDKDITKLINYLKSVL